MEIKGTPLSEIGLYGLIKRYNIKTDNKQNSTVIGIGDDSAVLGNFDGYRLMSNLLFLEGIHFDLIYTPLKHLGYKVVVAIMSDLLAMNGKPTQIIVGLGVSNKMTLEMVDDLMDGIMWACENYKVDIVGFRPSPSLTGLSVSLSLSGVVLKSKLVTRKNGNPTDILCISGDLGSAFMGLQLLEREKRVVGTSGDVKPEFGNNDYILERQLKPKAKVEVIEFFNKKTIQPTSMINVKDGLAAALLLLCDASGTGCRIYENKIPLHQATLKACHEMNFNPLIAALNGGEDYEMLFSLPLKTFESIKAELPDNIGVIGHLTEVQKGCRMITGSDQEIEIKAQGWVV